MGDKIFFPNSAQFDIMNEHLAQIAKGLHFNVDTSTWKGIQRAVRTGVAPDVLPIGTQLTVSHSVYGECVVDVVAHDHYESVHDPKAHSMTLMFHEPIPGEQSFDGREAFFRADVTLPAGTYHFTLDTTYSSWAAGTYQFTTTNNILAGEHLTLSNAYLTVPLTSYSVNHFSSASATTLVASYPITSGNSGTNLGTFGRELNHVQRVALGSNNYKESAIRQYLNSSATTSGWWQPQTPFDRVPSPLLTSGFVSGFNDEFLACVGKVIVPCATNGAYESPNSTTSPNEMYTVTDKFYLASQVEIFGTSSTATPDLSQQFPYFKDATNADRIKYKNGSAAPWWTRSALNTVPYSNKIVDYKGESSHYDAMGALGIVPVFTIV